MQVYYFARRDSFSRLGMKPEDFRRTFEILAADTDTRDLVVALYLRSSPRWLGGTAYVRQWVTPGRFLARSGKWRLVDAKAQPSDLPARFKLIRLLLPDNAAYPLDEKDRYGWRHHYKAFSDHLAFYFAHELHHFRRYHLNFHPGEGEHSANAWAVARCQHDGFAVRSQRAAPLPRRKPRARQTPTFWQLFNPADFFAGERAHALWNDSLKRAGLALRLSKKDKARYVAEKCQAGLRLYERTPGTLVRITFDPGRRYDGQRARIVRRLRQPSVRLLIETPDGKQWRWPLSWLAAEDE